MDPGQVMRLKYGTYNSNMPLPHSIPEKEKFESVIGGNIGFNRTRRSISLLASLGCKLTKVKGTKQYDIVLVKRTRRGHTTEKHLGTYKKAAFFELAMSLNPQLGRDE